MLGSPDTDIRLLTGTLWRTGSIDFNPSSYSFTGIGTDGRTFDLTYNIAEADKVHFWPSFDISAWNIIQSNLNRQAAPVPTAGAPYKSASQTAPQIGGSTWDNFWSQLANDPLGAPIAQAEKVASNTAKAVFNSPTLETLAILGIIGFGIYLMTESKK